jgi:hypothetical protein
VVTDLPATDETGVMQERTGIPSRCTVHAPQSEAPHPYFVPVRFRVSRKVHNKLASDAVSTCTDFPLSLKLVFISEVNLLNYGIGRKFLKNENIGAC